MDNCGVCGTKCTYTITVPREQNTEMCIPCLDKFLSLFPCPVNWVRDREIHGCRVITKNNKK
jgi:hypothetical protein